MNSILRGETTIEITITARQLRTDDEWELSVVAVYGPRLPGAGEYSGQIILPEAEGRAIFEALPAAVQAKLLEECAENAEVEDDEDPPSREEIADERDASDWAEHAE